MHVLMLMGNKMFWLDDQRFNVFSHITLIVRLHYTIALSICYLVVANMNSVLNLYLQSINILILSQLNILSYSQRFQRLSFRVVIILFWQPKSNFSDVTRVPKHCVVCENHHQDMFSLHRTPKSTKSKVCLNTSRLSTVILSRQRQILLNACVFIYRVWLNDFFSNFVLSINK